MDYWAEQDERTLNTALALLKEQEDHASKGKAAARGQRAPGAGGPQYSG